MTILKEPTTIPELQNIVEHVQLNQKILLRYSTDSLISFFSALAKSWQDPNNEIQKKYVSHGINYLIFWMRTASLTNLVNLSLRGNRGCLDEFSSLPYHTTDLFLASPRGIAIHWLAANVPILGILSLVQGVLSKNGNILKVPTNEGELLADIVLSMQDIHIDTNQGPLHGKDILNTIALLKIPRKQLSLHQYLSLSSDVRIAWGGQEAVESITNLPKKSTTEDIVFGPKISFMVIGKEALENQPSAISIAKKAAIDISVFDQRGCNSPHTIFIESQANIKGKQFAEILSTELENALLRYPVNKKQPADTIQILTSRAYYDMCETAFYPKHLGWTVLYNKGHRKINKPLFNRTVIVTEVENIYSVTEQCSPNTQTAGVALSPERKIKFAKLACRNGVHRVPDVGSMSAHDAPWDGLFTMDRLIKWSKITASES